MDLESQSITRERVLAVLDGEGVADRRCVAQMPDDVASRLPGYSRLNPRSCEQVEQHLQALVDDGLVMTVELHGVTHYRRRGTIAGVRVEFEPDADVAALDVFRPSSVFLPNPIVFGRSLFGKAEAEHWAWLMILGLARTGDRWRPISTKQVADVARAEALASERVSLALRNQLFRPSARELLDRGWAVETDGKIAFTLGALVRLAASGWVR